MNLSSKYVVCMVDSEIMRPMEHMAAYECTKCAARLSYSKIFDPENDQCVIVDKKEWKK